MGNDAVSAAASQLGAPARRALALAGLTIAWNSVEAVSAITFGILAGSVALSGFGFDSLIEVLAAAVVMARLRREVRDQAVDETAERRALRFVAATFVVLAIYVVVTGARDLITASRPEVSIGGIVVTSLSLVVMPLLAAAKTRAGRALGSRSSWPKRPRPDCVRGSRPRPWPASSPTPSSAGGGPTRLPGSPLPFSPSKKPGRRGRATSVATERRDIVVVCASASSPLGVRGGHRPAGLC